MNHPVENENLIAAAIDAAEDIRDPLEELAEKNRGRSRRAVRVRGAGATLRVEEGRSCRVRGAPRATEEGQAPSDGQSAELFHAPDGSGFADLDINNHRESDGFEGLGRKRGRLGRKWGRNRPR